MVTVSRVAVTGVIALHFANVNMANPSHFSLAFVIKLLFSFVNYCNVKCLHRKYYIINLFYYKSFQILSLQGEGYKEEGNREKK